MLTRDTTGHQRMSLPSNPSDQNNRLWPRGLDPDSFGNFSATISKYFDIVSFNITFISCNITLSSSMEPYSYSTKKIEVTPSFILFCARNRNARQEKF